MECIGALETICRYPVKSMAGEELDEAFVGFAGMMGDRAYAFVRAPGPKGFPWHTGREQEDLILYRPRYRETAGATLPADIERSFGMAPGVNPIFPEAEAFAVNVTTPSGRTLPVGSPELRAELEERSGQAVTLRFSERSLYDCRPLSLFGNALAELLGEELGMTLDRRRFRANFYADWSDGRPHGEDELVGCTLQVGERLRLSVLERDPRCKMITLDPDTGREEPRVLRHVTKVHDGMAGVYAAVLVEGVVRKGDPIWLV
ncbi:MAG: molybdenum cofactor biosynthesis protein [Microvirga sp.]|jgi:uncharacterized protein YcbX|nr:molybdenum cofactor biosynthesis protein [Thermomicrobiales bacterium]MDF2973293.1 molybdenum cofactor biosynthesis protein [Microvirga sp.]